MVKDLQGLSSRVGKLKHKLDTVETAVGLRGRNGGLVPRSEFTDFSKVVREEVLRLATPEEVVAFQDFLVGEVAELATKSQYDKVVYALGQTSSTLLDKVSSVKKDVAELERAVQDEATLPKATTMVHLLSSLRQSLASGLASTEQQQEAERIATWPQISELQTMLATAVQTDANDVRVMGTLRSKLTEMAGRRLLSSELEGLDVVVRKLTNELEANMYGRDLHEPEDELAIHMPPTPLTSPPTLSAMASPTVSPLKTAVAGGLATPLRSHQPSPAGSRRVQVPA
ncbi:MAG: uncharacterized protein KVP18_001390 [Porospora cf. gigantea A]|uniref:uncharacterized protein n=1 Tax=Porospora cf. gigantea A TaxID=2853593 RepID=UPI00355A4F77|nr:MAG: hypothetical protein KVP18_001390 [Porospora cf. gigantea A]